MSLFRSEHPDLGNFTARATNNVDPVAKFLDVDGNTVFQAAATETGVGIGESFDVTFSYIATSVDEQRYTANSAVRVVAIRNILTAAGAASSTLQLRKATGTQGPAAGVVLTTATFALDAALNTVQVGTLSATVADLKLAVGDRVTLDFTGTLTGLNGAVTVTFKRI